MRSGSADGFRASLSRTIGQKFDCSDGWEFTYVGPFEWESHQEAFGAGFDSSFIPDGVSVSAFNDAVFHSQSYETKWNSFEFNQKRWAWDVFSQTWGARYIALSTISLSTH